MRTGAGSGSESQVSTAAGIVHIEQPLCCCYAQVVEAGFLDQSGSATVRKGLIGPS